MRVNNDREKKAAHKDKSDSRRRLDVKDRNKFKIREELKKNINPISSEQEHHINIMNGRTAPSEVNVDNALAIGEHMPQLQTFIVSLPDTFHMQIKKEVVTMKQLKKKGQSQRHEYLQYRKAMYASLLFISQSRDLHLSIVITLQIF